MLPTSGRIWGGAAMLVAAISLTSTGCAKPVSGHVYGTVYQSNGKPLPGGSVVFYPTEGRGKHATAEIQSDGTYDMPQAPYGKVQIAVNNLHLKEGIPPPIGAPGAPGMPPPPKKGAGPPMMMKGKGPPKDVAAGPPKDAPERDKSTATGVAPTPDRYVPIDKKFTNPETSGLTTEVKGGKQQFDIHLK